MANIIKAMVCPCILLCATATAFAQDVKVHLDEAGTLESKIERSRYDQIKKLTVSGYVNTIDINEISNMDYLEVLDLTDATILATGTSGENNTIGKNYFANCEMRTLMLPNTLLYIENNAFDYAPDLESIRIGDNLISISDQALVNPPSLYGHSTRTRANLKEFTVSEKNKNFCAVDGVLYSKDMSTLLFYPNKKAKTYSVPEGVTSIRARAFSWCTDLLEISLPESLEEIGASAFECCNHLLSVTSYNPVPPTTESELFYKASTETCVLYVPEGSYSAYWMAPGWGVFDNIVEIDPRPSKPHHARRLRCAA